MGPLTPPLVSTARLIELRQVSCVTLFVHLFSLLHSELELITFLIVLLDGGVTRSPPPPPPCPFQALLTTHHASLPTRGSNQPPAREVVPSRGPPCDPSGQGSQGPFPCWGLGGQRLRPTPLPGHISTITKQNPDDPFVLWGR